MNGWADKEPAWWLNLQAQPDTTVQLADGSRAVRARAAAGTERERLWASFRDYIGWGDDLDALRAATFGKGSGRTRAAARRVKPRAGAIDG